MTQKIKFFLLSNCILISIFIAHAIFFPNNQFNWILAYMLLFLGVYIVVSLSYLSVILDNKQLNFGFFIGSFLKMGISAWFILNKITIIPNSSTLLIQFMGLYLISLLIEIIIVVKLIQHK